MVSGAILLLALAVLVVRFASARFPAVSVDSRQRVRNYEDANAERDDLVD